MVTDYEKLVIGEYHEQKGFKEGLEQGRAEGEANALAAVAKKLREIGVDEQSIRQATGLAQTQTDYFLILILFKPEAPTEPRAFFYSRKCCLYLHRDEVDKKKYGPNCRSL